MAILDVSSRSGINATEVKLPESVIAQIAQDLGINDISRIPTKLIVTALSIEVATASGIESTTTNSYFNAAVIA